jgi:hypothetical protein
MIQGWNWYAGADPAQIGSDQFDFQTVVTHELGQALGLVGWQPSRSRATCQRRPGRLGS